MDVIKKLHETNGDLLLPVTHEKAVRDDNGNNLESKLGLINEALEDLEEGKLNVSSEQSLTPQEKQMALANLGLGNGSVDSEPTKDSQNVVRSGGVWNYIKENSGEFDVSEYNESGSTPKTYSGLTAALNDVPSDYRVGGMSIKFINTIGKYSHYTYNMQSIDDTTFKNTDNWMASIALVDDGEVSIPDFNPETDTLHVTSGQTLSDDQKVYALQNLGLGDGTVDQRPTSGSTNLVESGGVFKDIFDNTGAFDISEYNSVGGNPMTYSGLTEALTYVPQEYRKGGMSVKYVHTSDNKYVKFFCTADEFTTDVTKWQGVDDKLTPGSNNLVKSGEVYAGIVESMLETSLEISYFTSKTGGILNDGTFGTSSNYKHGVISVKQGEVFILENSNISTDTVRYAFATTDESSTGSSVPLVPGTSISNVNHQSKSLIVIPEGCSYLLWNADGYNSTLFKVMPYDSCIFSLVGGGETAATTSLYYNIKVGNKYRLWLKDKNIFTTRLRIRVHNKIEDSITSLINFTDNSGLNLLDYYDFVIPENTDYFYISSLFEQGFVQTYFLEDISSISEANKLITNLFSGNLITPLSKIGISVNTTTNKTTNSNSYGVHWVKCSKGETFKVHLYNRYSRDEAGVVCFSVLEPNILGIDVVILDSENIPSKTEAVKTYIAPNDGYMLFRYYIGRLDVLLYKIQDFSALVGLDKEFIELSGGQTNRGLCVDTSLSEFNSEIALNSASFSVSDYIDVSDCGFIAIPHFYGTSQSIGGIYGTIGNLFYKETEQEISGETTTLIEPLSIISGGVEVSNEYYQSHVPNFRYIISYYKVPSDAKYIRMTLYGSRNWIIKFKQPFNINTTDIDAICDNLQYQPQSSFNKRSLIVNEETSKISGTTLTSYLLKWTECEKGELFKLKLERLSGRRDIVIFYSEEVPTLEGVDVEILNKVILTSEIPSSEIDIIAPNNGYIGWSMQYAYVSVEFTKVFNITQLVGLESKVYEIPSYTEKKLLICDENDANYGDTVTILSSNYGTSDLIDISDCIYIGFSPGMYYNDDVLDGTYGCMFYDENEEPLIPFNGCSYRYTSAFTYKTSDRSYIKVPTEAKYLRWCSSISRMFFIKYVNKTTEDPSYEQINSFIGFGTSGEEAGITEIGQMYYHTSQYKFKKAISEGATEGTFNYEDIAPNTNSLYFYGNVPFKFRPSGDYVVAVSEMMSGCIIGNGGGQGSTQLDSGHRIKLKAGVRYRILIEFPEVDEGSYSGNYWFGIYASINGESTPIVRWSGKSEIPSYYDFDAIDADYYTFKGRHNNGKIIYFRIFQSAQLGSDASVNEVLKENAESVNASATIFELNPDMEMLPKIVSARKKYYTNPSSDNPYTVLMLAHASDVHGASAQYARFIEFANHWKEKGYIDELIDTGDIVSSSYVDGVTWRDSIEGVENIITAIGNHDTNADTAEIESVDYPIGQNRWQYHSNISLDSSKRKESYLRYMVGPNQEEPYIDNWGVIQPENAEEDGLCYYYKDYATKHIRMVIIDVMGYNQTEDEWLQATLADTLDANNSAYGYHVVILAHFTGGLMTNLPCNYTSLFNPGTNLNTLTMYNSYVVNMPIAVDSFQSNGGVFVGYIIGHYHRDMINVLTNYPKQLVFAVSSAGRTSIRDFTKIAGSKSYDDFQIIGIDAYKKVVKLIKVGADTDYYMRKKGTISVGYNLVKDDGTEPEPGESSTRVKGIIGEGW